MNIIHKRVVSAVCISIAALFACLGAGLMDGGSEFSGWIIAALVLVAIAAVLWASANRQEWKEFDAELMRQIKELDAEHGRE